jgi:hypothetical protein
MRIQQSSTPVGPRLKRTHLISVCLAWALCACLTMWILLPVWEAPTSTMICDSQHPDCISNHWLMVFVAEQLAGGGSILHNDRYYWPIGDALCWPGTGEKASSILCFTKSSAGPQEP